MGCKPQHSVGKSCIQPTLPSLYYILHQKMCLYNCLITTALLSEDGWIKLNDAQLIASITSSILVTLPPRRAAQSRWLAISQRCKSYQGSPGPEVQLIQIAWIYNAAGTKSSDCLVGWVKLLWIFDVLVFSACKNTSKPTGFYITGVPNQGNQLAPIA